MKTKKLDGMKNQRGTALILVLIALALGSLLIPSTLNYTYTGLVGSRVSEEQFIDQYTADAAVEYALWQLKNNVGGLTDQLNPENPSDDTSITVNDTEVPITTEITQSPLGDDWPFSVPSSQSGIHMTTALVIAPPVYSEDGQIAYFTHIVYIFNSGTSTLHMKAAFQQLDRRLTYLPGSFYGPDADLTETYVDDHWELHFDFDKPLPTLGAGEATFISWVASTTEEVGEDPYEGSGYVSYAAFGAEEEELFEGEYEPGTVGACYDITITVGSSTIRVNTGITDEGEIVLLSYQIE